MGCISSTTNRQAQQPTYQALLSEMFELVVREEQLLKFSKKAEIYKYYNEFDWNAIQGQFKQQVRTLMDHIESYKIRLNDTALYVENKIVLYLFLIRFKKLSYNPIILKMSLLILVELVSNLQKFTQQQNIPINQNTQHDDSKNEASQRSISVQIVSDNFLKFELAFSNILSQLIKNKLTYIFIWAEYLYQSLEVFSKKSTKQFQSENIQSILAFLEYIIGSKYQSEQFEWVFQNQEEQLCVTEYLDSLKDISHILIVYKETLTMTPSDRLFQTKQQRLLFKLLISRYNENTEDWLKLTEIFIQRALAQQQFEEVFIIIYNNFDEEQWTDCESLIKITKTLLSVAKHNNLQSNLEIYLISKFIEYLESSQSNSVLESPGQTILIKKMSETVNKMLGNSLLKSKVLRILIVILDNLDSGQFILFQQTSIIKSILVNLRMNTNDEEMLELSKISLVKLLQLVSPDKSAFQSFLLQMIIFLHQYNQCIINKTVINEDFLVKFFDMLNSLIKMAELFEKLSVMSDEILYMILNINDTNPALQRQCTQLIINLFQQQNEETDNNSYYIPNQDLLILSAYQVAQSLLLYEEFHQEFFEQVLPKLPQTVLYSFILYFIEDQNRLKKSVTRKLDFDQRIDKSTRIVLIIKLIAQFNEDVEFNQFLYQLLGQKFQQIKKKPTNHDIELAIKEKNVAEIINQISNICQGKTQIDFEKIKNQFLEGFQNLKVQNGIIDMEDIQIKDDIERGSLYQSFQAPSKVDIMLDESFEKQLQTIKKQRMKQEKLEHLTTEQKEMVEF